MIRCIAIDDEPLALQQMERYIRKTPFLQFVRACRSGLEAMEFLSEHPVDLLFVDINMPDLNGLDFVRLLSANPLVVFTTAYSEYAIEGFRVDALDYLLKPIGYSDFLRSAEKVQKQFNLLKDNCMSRGEPKSLFVKSDYKTIKIDIDKITYIESRGEYVRIYTEDMSPVMPLGSLKSYEECLPSDRFTRVHRSYIVNLDKIRAIERKQILIGDKIRIAIGEIYEENFRKHLEKRSL